MLAQIRGLYCRSEHQRRWRSSGAARLSCQNEGKAPKFTRNWELSEESRLIACVTTQIESSWLDGLARASAAVAENESVADVSKSDRGMDPSEWALAHRPFIFFLMILCTVVGVLAYIGLGRSEDPPFTVKTMHRQGDLARCHDHRNHESCYGHD